MVGKFFTLKILGRQSLNILSTSDHHAVYYMFFTEMCAAVSN